MFSFETLVGCGLLVLIFLLGFIVMQDNTFRQFLFKQCILDGKKPYECALILRQGVIK